VTICDFTAVGLVCMSFGFAVMMYFVAEVDELTGRLKASRQRVADLERNFTTASNSSQKNEKVIHLK